MLCDILFYLIWQFAKYGNGGRDPTIRCKTAGHKSEQHPIALVAVSQDQSVLQLYYKLHFYTSTSERQWLEETKDAAWPTKVISAESATYAVLPANGKGGGGLKAVANFHSCPENKR